MPLRIFLWKALCESKKFHPLLCILRQNFIFRKYSILSTRSPNLNCNKIFLLFIKLFCYVYIEEIWCKKPTECFCLASSVSFRRVSWFQASNRRHNKERSDTSLPHYRKSQRAVPGLVNSAAKPYFWGPVALFFC